MNWAEKDRLQNQLAKLTGCDPKSYNHTTSDRLRELIHRHEAAQPQKGQDNDKMAT